MNAELIRLAESLQADRAETEDVDLRASLKMSEEVLLGLAKAFAVPAERHGKSGST